MTGGDGDQAPGRHLDEVLDQLLGLQRALEAAASHDDIAALSCRMVERLTGATEALLCLAGTDIAANGEGWRSLPVATTRRSFGVLALRGGNGGAVAAAAARIVAGELEVRAAARRDLADPPGEAAGGLARLLLRAVEQCRASIIITDAEGRFDYVNPGFVRATGYRPEEVIGLTPSLLKSGLTPPEEYGAMWQVIAAGEVWHGEFHNRRRDGSLYWVAASVAPVRDEAGVVTHYVAVEEDITDLKRYQAALLAARSAAEDANAAKSVFLATMSHELRTPLNAILGFSELIRDQAFGPVGIERYVEYAGDIHASGRHLLDLITAILDISKIEAGKLELDIHRIPLRQTLEQCRHLVAPRAEGGSLTLVGELEEALPDIFADERAVRQMVLNLLSNAVKYTPVGGRVTLRAAADGSGWVEIAVVDTGIGIPEDQLDRVLRPFEQLDNSYTRGAGGTGLGLALVKALADLHGGTLHLASAVGQGTTASIRLPVAGPATTTAAAPWTFSFGHGGL